MGWSGIKEHGFNAHPENIWKGGRGKSSYRKFCDLLNEEGYEKVSKLDFEDAISLLIEIDTKNIKDIAKSQTLPHSLIVIAKALLRKDAIKLVIALQERLFGKPVQPVDSNLNVYEKAKELFPTEEEIINNLKEEEKK